MLPSSLFFVVPLYIIWACKLRDNELFYHCSIFHIESCISEIAILEQEILVFLCVRNGCVHFPLPEKGMQNISL